MEVNDMKKSTLLTISDIINTLETHNSELMGLLEYLNLTPEEYSSVFDSIQVLAEKIERIKRTSIKNLDEYVDINYIENMFS
jgi:L-lactate utilization protein LutB